MPERLYGERLAGMEVEIREMKEALINHTKEDKEHFEAINTKLDALLALRNKGAGILWLLSGLLGGLGAMFEFFHWK